MNTQKGNIVVFFIVLAVMFTIIMFLKVDWKTGEHGRLTITAVDKNLFGTYRIYARNTESMSGNDLLEITYCIDSDNKELAQKAKDSIGKQNTKLVYPERRIGFYWFDKCGSAPIKEIILSQ